MRASRFCSGPMPSGNSVVAATKKASTTTTSPGRRSTSRRSRRNSAPNAVMRRGPGREPPACRAPHAWRRSRGRRRQGVCASTACSDFCDARSSALNGSSSSHAFAREAATLASAVRRRWPAESVRTGRFARETRSKSASAASIARLVGRGAAQALGDVDVLGDGEVALEAVEMAQPGDIGLLPGDRARLGPAERGQRAQQGRLAAAVGAGQRQQLAAAQGEGKSVEDASSAAAAGQSGHGQKGGRHAPPWYHAGKKKAALPGENDKAAETPPRRLERGFGDTTFGGDTSDTWKRGVAVARPKWGKTKVFEPREAGAKTLVLPGGRQRIQSMRESPHRAE